MGKKEDCHCHGACCANDIVKKCNHKDCYGCNDLVVKHCVECPNCGRGGCQINHEQNYQRKGIISPLYHCKPQQSSWEHDCNTCGHKSDCAIHNEPALPKGECNCKDWENDLLEISQMQEWHLSPPELDELKIFISSLLSAQRQELIKIVKNYKCGEHKKLLAKLEK